MSSPQKGAIGVTIELTVKEDGVAVDLSTATTKNLVFVRPDKTFFEKATTFVTNGTDGKIKYVTTGSDDLNMAGLWKVQGELVFPGGFNGRTSIAIFEVEANPDGA